jgi:hypothetical protein
VKGSGHKGVTKNPKIDKKVFLVADMYPRPSGAMKQSSLPN